ncbi:MAG: two-component regulator propeller domain-containing protein, partial [Bacteroidota bacterium]
MNILVLLLHMVPAMAQEYNFKNLSVADGLAQSQVYAMCEDRRGNIWFGTRGGGISRYDGVAFASYGEENGLVDNYVRAILEDRSGTLWIGTDHGVSRYDGRRFT